MTEEKTTVVPAVEKEVEPTPANQDPKPEEPKPEGGEVVKKEGEEKNSDWYEGELIRIRGAHKIEIDKKQVVIDHKNRAIDVLKKKPKEVEEPDPTDEEMVTIGKKVYPKSDVEAIQQIAKGATEESLGKKIDALADTINASKIDQMLVTMTDNVSERELIKVHYETSIKPTGDLKEDLTNARILANKNLIFNEGLKEGEEKSREDVIASFTTPKTSTSGKTSGGELDMNDPAVKLILATNPNALKNPEVVKKLKGE